MILRFLRRPLRLHTWQYRNPFDRTCRICGRHEVMYTLNTIPPSRSWWEICNKGEPTARPCGRKEARS